MKRVLVTLILTIILITGCSPQASTPQTKTTPTPSYPGSTATKPPISIPKPTPIQTATYTPPTPTTPTATTPINTKGSVTLSGRLGAGITRPIKWIVPDDYPSLTDAIQVAQAGEVILIKSSATKLPPVVIIDKPIWLVGEEPKSTQLPSISIQKPAGSVVLKYLTAATTPRHRLGGS